MSVTFATNEDLELIEKRLSDLEYVPIKINSFLCYNSRVEIGRTIDTVFLEWELNKTATSISLDGITVSPDLNKTTLTGLTITQNTTWSLKVVDERGLEVSKSTSMKFVNGVYYGAATGDQTYDSDFVLGLSRKILSSSKVETIYVTANEGEYIYYCVPTRFGDCSFEVGGFDGGFEKVSTFNFTNESGYTESYDIYKSTNASLGYTKVTIT